MKFFSLLAVGISTLAAAVPLAPRATEAQLDSASATLQDLMSKVQRLTGPLNSTMAGVPANIKSNSAQVASVAAQIAPQMKQLQELLAAADAAVKAGTTQKRDETGLEKRLCDAQCLTGLASLIVAEISGTIKGIVGKLGSGNPVIVIVDPVLGAVKGLLVTLDGLVAGLLNTVGGLLAGLLKGLGLDGLLNNLLGGLLGGILGPILGGGGSGCGLLGLFC